MFWIKKNTKVTTNRVGENYQGGSYAASSIDTKTDKDFFYSTFFKKKFFLNFFFLGGGSF